MGVESLKDRLDMGTVHVADEVATDASIEASKRFHRHGRTQIGTANPDVHHVRDFTIGVHVLHVVHKVQHAISDVDHIFDDIESVH